MVRPCISLRPLFDSRTPRTSERAPGNPRVPSAAAVLVVGGGEPAARVPGLCRGSARSGAGPRAAGVAPSGRVGLQARPGDRAETEGQRFVGRQLARAGGVQGLRLDRAGDRVSVPAADRAWLAAGRAGVPGRGPVPVPAAVAHRAGRPGQERLAAGARAVGGVSEARPYGPRAGALGAADGTRGRRRYTGAWRP